MGDCRTISQPTPPQTEEFIRNAIENQELLTITSRCEVDYRGRASGYLGVGERLTILKPDGTLLVHQNTKSDPVNWQPPGSRPSVKRDKETVTLISERTSPDETLEVTIHEVINASSHTLKDGVELTLNKQESQMQKQIMENPDTLEEGLRIIEKERETGYGRIDLFARDQNGKNVIIELKRKRVGPKAVDQLKRYMDYYREKGYSELRGILVAPSITENAERRLENQELEHIEMEPPKQNPQRIKTLDQFKRE